jgi:hypothetical protein
MCSGEPTAAAAAAAAALSSAASPNTGYLIINHLLI